MAYRVRYVMQFNAREAIHMLELRSSPQTDRRFSTSPRARVAEGPSSNAERRARAASTEGPSTSTGPAAP